MSWDNDSYTCPYCNRDDLVLPFGPKRSSILIIGEFPGEDEIKKGRPMTGPMGGVLRTELAKLGLDTHSMRLTNLWLHPPNDNKECFNYGLESVIKEAKGRKAILLIGSETVKFFTGENVSEVNGLQVKSTYFSAPIVFACVQPAIVFHKPIGELRLSLQKFVKLVESIE